MPIKSKSAITDANGSLIIDEVEIYEPLAGEVLVRIMASGICHTDYDSLSWGKRIIMGHEGSGIVEQVGDGVQNVRVGDRVILNWAIPCNECFQCMHGNHNICENNNQVTERIPGYGSAHSGASTYKGTPIGRSFNIGTLSNYTVVKKEAVVRIPDDVPFASACIVGCGVMTGYGSVVNCAKVEAGSSVAVIGTGGVGLNVIQGARISGAAKIIAVDISKNRLNLAKKFGATHAVLVSKKDAGLNQASEQIKALCARRGTDYAFECTGIPALGAAPLAMIRNGGMAVQVSGIEQTIEIDMNLFEWDKLYLNPLYGGANPEYDFPKLIELYKLGALKLDELVTQTYSLDDLNVAIEDMLNGKNAKGVILMEH